MRQFIGLFLIYFNIPLVFLIKFSFDIYGGKSFSKNILIDDEITCPCSSRNPLRISDQFRFMAGGDTIGLVSLPDNTFSIVYSAGKDVVLKNAVIAVEK